ncbi:unnamed protein product [Trichobilharzia regenti]|nr:unnamed protein product [Trichobilharzia regenti]
MTTTATNKCRQPRESPSNKTKARSNVDVVASNSISSNSKLSNHGNGVQPYALNHSLTLNPIFAQLLHMDSGVQEDTAVSDDDCDECIPCVLLLLFLKKKTSLTDRVACPQLVEEVFGLLLK